MAQDLYDISSFELPPLDGGKSTTSTQPAQQPAQVVNETEQYQPTKFDLEQHFGVSEYGNDVDWDTLKAKLNEARSKGQIDSQQQYDIEQTFLKGAEFYIRNTGDESIRPWLEKVKNEEMVQGEYSLTKDAMNHAKIGTAELFRDVDNMVTHGTNALKMEIGNKDYVAKLRELYPEVVDRYQEIKNARQKIAMDLYKGARSAYAVDPKLIEQKLLEQYPDALAVEKEYNEKANNLVEELTEKELAGRMYSFTDYDGKERSMPYREAIKYLRENKTKFASDSAYEEARQRGEWGADVGVMEAISRSISQNIETSVRTLPMTASSIVAAVAGQPWLSLALSSSVNVVIDTVDGKNDDIAELYKEQTGKDIGELSSSEYVKVVTNYARQGIISDSRAKNMIVGVLHSLAEAATGGFLEKFGGNAVTKNIKNKIARNVSQGLFGLTLANPGEEIIGDNVALVVKNVLDGKEWNKDVAENLVQSYLDTIFQAEGIASAGRTIVFGENENAHITPKQPIGGEKDEPTIKRPPQFDNVKQDSTTTKQGEPTPTEPAEVQGEDTAKQEQGTDKQDDTFDGIAIKDLKRYDDLLRKSSSESGLTADEENELNGLVLQYERMEEDELGGLHQYNPFTSVYNKWKQSQGGTNEDRDTNRDGSQNADGQTDGQGANEPNGSGAESGGTPSESVPGTETEATTERPSQPDERATTDITGEPNNNTQTSDTVGASGRTGETDSEPRESRELGQDGSEQGGEPTQTPSTGSTDSGVQQRTESDSSGETLTPEQRAKRVAELEKQEKADWAKALQERERKIEQAYSDAIDLDSDVDPDEYIKQSEQNIRDFTANFDFDNAQREADMHLSAGYKAKEIKTGESQLEAYKAKRDELGVNDTITSPVTKELDRLRKEEADYQAQQKQGDQKVGSNADESSNGAEQEPDQSDDETPKTNGKKTPKPKKKTNGKKQSKPTDGEQPSGDTEQPTGNGSDSTTVPNEKPTFKSPSDTATPSEPTKQGGSNERKGKSKRDIAEETLELVKDKIKNGSINDVTADDVLNLTAIRGGRKKIEAYLAVLNTALGNGVNRDEVLNKLQNLNKDPRLSIEWRTVENAISRVGTRSTDPMYEHIRKNIWDRVGNLNEIDSLAKKVREALNNNTFSNLSDDEKRKAFDYFLGNDKYKNKIPGKKQREKLTEEKANFDKAKKSDGETSKYKFGKNLTVTFTEHGNSSVTAQIYNRTGMYTKQLPNLILAKHWVEQTLIGKDLQAWKNNRKLSEGEGVFDETIGGEKPDGLLSRRAWLEKQGGKEAVEAKIASFEERYPYLKPENVQNYIWVGRASIDAAETKTPAEARQAVLQKREARKKAKQSSYTFTGDLRNKQKQANQYLQEKPGDEEAIKKAFLASVGGEYANASWEVAKRGYIKYSSYNDKHKELKANLGEKEKGRKLLGFDFEDKPVFDETPKSSEQVEAEELFPDLTPTEQVLSETVGGDTEYVFSSVKDTLSGEEKVAIGAVMKKLGLGSFDDLTTTNVLDVLAKTEQYITDTANVGNDSNLSDKNKDLVGKARVLLNLAKKALIKLKNAVYSVLAVVAVGAMTIPTDVHAQQGFANYTQGERIQGVSQDVSNTANWVVANKDHNGKNFVVADKDNGKIHVFSKEGKLLNTQNALFGKNKGNDNSFGNTPSGRFKLTKTMTKDLTKADQRVFGDSVLDVTNPTTGKAVRSKQGGIIAMHRVVNKPERKAALQSATANDNYLSHGCINIPTAFYDTSSDTLSGAMFYVLDQTNAKQDTKPTKTNGLKSNGSKLKVGSSGLKVGGSGLKVGKSALRNSIKPADLAQVNPAIREDKLAKHLSTALGKHVGKVTLISKDDLTTDRGYQYFTKNGIEGFFDPKSKHVYIVADNIQAQNGLTAEQRIAWVGWHELAHLGLDVKYGDDLTSQLEMLGNNPFIADLAKAIQQERINRSEAVSVNDNLAVEEALAELNAAIKTGNMKALQERYNVDIPKAFLPFTESVLDKFLNRLKGIFRKVMGRGSMTNEQVRDLLAGLDEAIAQHAEPETRALTERLHEIEHELDGEPDYKYSIGDTIDEMVNKVMRGVDELSKRGERSALNTAGADPNAVDTTIRQDEINESNLNFDEKYQEAFLDAERRAVKWLGGYGTKAAQTLKLTKNAIAQQHRKLKNAVELLNAQFKAKAKQLAKKGIYSKNNLHAIDTDIMLGNTSLAAIVKDSRNGISSENEVIRNKYHEMINGKDITRKDGSILHIPGLKEELANYGYDEATQTSVYATPYQQRKIAELKEKIERAEEILNTIDRNQNEILSQKVAKKRGIDEAGLNKLRKNWRGHNGLTTAEAYNMLTKLVEQGKLDITYQGKPWLDYIKDVGFTKDDGFADVNKDYTLEIADLEVQGELAGLMQETVKLGKRMYSFQRNALGKELGGYSTTHPFFTPTMGQVENVKTETNSLGNGDFLISGEGNSIEERISKAEAAEWQNQRLGRAFLGAGALQNLDLLSSLVSQRVGWQDMGHQIFNDHIDGNYRARIIRTNEPGFAEAKGILIALNEHDYNDWLKSKNKNHKHVKIQGKVYVKVSLDNDLANEAMFGSNVEMVADNSFNRFIQLATRMVSVSLTATPVFSLYNAYRGLREKLSQIKAWTFTQTKDGGNAANYFASKLSPEMRAMLDGPTGSKFATKLFYTVAKDLATGILGGGYLRAAVVMALEMGDNGKDNTNSALRKAMLASPKARMAYTKLKLIHEMGGISTRASQTKLDADSLAKMYAKGGFVGTTARKFEQAQDRLLTLTTAFELISTLSTVKTLEAFGMKTDDAVSANLFFMNFNDRGASKTSAYLRATAPFINAAAQGSRSTGRVFATKNGWKNMGRRVATTLVTMLITQMLSEAFPCEEEKDKDLYRDINPAELSRSIPLKIGCGGALRLPVAYGADMIAHALGVTIYQSAFSNNWSPRQSLTYLWHVLAENSLPLSTTVNSKAGLFEQFTSPFIPYPVKKIMNTMRDVDDFGNPLSRYGADDKRFKYEHGKPTTADFWGGVAESLYTLGIANLTPEQAKYAMGAIFTDYGVNFIDSFLAPTKSNETRLSKVLFNMTGARTAWQKGRTPEQALFIKTQNNLGRYTQITTEIGEAMERKGSDKLRLGKETSNTVKWVRDRIKDGTFTEEDGEKAKVILAYLKQVERIGKSKKISQDKKNALYFENNQKYLEAIRKLEEQ